jgi:hypothetical protein
VRALLAHGFHQVGLSAAKAVEATLGIADDHAAASTASTDTLPAQAGAMGLLSMLLETQVGKIRGPKARAAHRSLSPPAPRSPPKPAPAPSLSRTTRAAFPRKRVAAPKSLSRTAGAAKKRSKRKAATSQQPAQARVKNAEPAADPTCVATRVVWEDAAVVDSTTTPARRPNVAAAQRDQLTTTIERHPSSHTMAATTVVSSPPCATSSLEGGHAELAGVSASVSSLDRDVEEPERVSASQLRMQLGGQSLSGALGSAFQGARRGVQVDAAAEILATDAVRPTEQ